jgi:hypothetical protein
MRRAARRAPDPNGQGRRTHAQTYPRPDVNGPNQTIFGLKMCRAVGVAAHGARTSDVLPRLSCLDDPYLMMIHQGAHQH